MDLVILVIHKSIHSISSLLTDVVRGIFYMSDHLKKDFQLMFDHLDIIYLDNDVNNDKIL